MARPGSKSKATELKVVAGTDQPVRRNEGAPELPDGAIEAPDYLNLHAKEVWDRVTPQLIVAGIMKPAYIDMMALYCHLAADVQSRMRREVEIPATLTQQIRTLAESFYLTAASTAGGTGPAKGKNRFAGHGCRPN